MGAPSATIRCTFLAFRTVDLLHQRSVELVDVPRVGDRIQMWFPDAGTVRGTVRDVRWIVPEDGSAACTVQIEIGASGGRRTARRRDGAAVAS